MAFEIELAHHAELDIGEAVNFIADDSPVGRPTGSRASFLP